MYFGNYVGAAVAWTDLEGCSTQDKLWEEDPTKLATEQVVADKMQEWRAKSVLDLGCGVGRYASALHYDRYVGIEQSLSMHTVADGKFAGNPYVTLIRARAEEVRVFPNNFDVGIVMHVTQHIINPKAFLLQLFMLHQCKRWIFTLLTVPGTEVKYFNIGELVAACALPIETARELANSLGKFIGGFTEEPSVGVEEARELIFWTEAE